MNEIPRQPKSRPTTQAAEGVPRLRWTLAEFERLGELGIFTEEDRIELIGGELVPMSPKGNRHEIVRAAIHNWLRRNLPDDVDYHAEPGLARQWDTLLRARFSGRPSRLCSPTAIRPDGRHAPDRGGALELEVRYNDQGRYVCIAWRARVLGDQCANPCATKVHRGPSAKGYASAVEVRPSRKLTPLSHPLLAR